MADLLQRERELVWWALAYSGVTISPALLKLDPAWDPLRTDSRLDALLKNTELSP